MKKISLLLVLTMLLSLLAIPQTGLAAGGVDPYVGFGMGKFDETTYANCRVTATGGLATSGANQTYTYTNIDFGEVSPTSVRLNLGADIKYAGDVISLYIDSTGGVPIAQIVAAPTASWTMQEHSAEITQKITGVHTLYMKTGAHTMDFGTIRFIQPLAGSLVYEEYSALNNSYKDIADSSYRRDINLVSGIGLSPKKGEYYYPTLPVTRGTFTDVVARMASADPASDSESVFTDVDSEHEYFDSIMYAYKAGYVVGFTDGTFRPEQFITLPDALRVASKVLGYDYIAKEKGGTDSAYYEIGKRFKLTDGLGSISVLTNETLARFVLNMVNAQHYIPTTFSEDEVRYEVHEDSFLAVMQDIYCTEGVIDANNVTRLTSPVTDYEEDYVSVDGADYIVGDSKARSLLGYECEIYYKLEDNKRTILAIEPLDSIRITELTTDKTDIISVNANEVRYYDENDREKKLSIDNAHILYNGVCADAALSTLMEADPFRGRIKYIENDCGVNVLFVDEYVNIELGGADTAQRSFYDNLSKKTYKYPEDEGFVYMTMDGKSVALSDAKTGLVAMLYESKNKEGKRFARLTLSDDVISGNITLIGSDMVSVGDNEYVIARECVETIKAGTGLELKLNAYGEVVAVNNNDTTLKRYAWLYKQCRTEYGFGDSIVLMRVRDKDNTINEYTLAETCVVNGRKYTDGTATLSDSMCNNPIIYYLDSEGKVREITTCGEGGLLTSKNLSGCYYNTGSRILTASSLSSYMLSETGAGMRRYESASVEDDWEWLSSPSFNANFGAVVYSTDFDSGVLDIIMWGGAPRSLKNESKISFVFKELWYEIDEFGNEIICVVGYTGSSEIKYTIDERNENADIELAGVLSKGDLVTASVGNDKMWNIELIYLASGENSLNYGSKNVTPLVGEHSPSYGTVSSTSSAPRYVYGQIIDRDGGHFRIERPGTGEIEFIYPGTVFGIKYKKSLGDGITYNVSKDAIEIGDTVVLVYTNTTLSNFYIVK